MLLCTDAATSLYILPIYVHTNLGYCILLSDEIFVSTGSQGNTEYHTTVLENLIEHLGQELGRVAINCSKQALYWMEH